jgi:hypothetical protein
MAYCNSCGANLEVGARFCPKCGASQPGAATTTPAQPVPVAASSSQGTNTLKVILIVIAAFVVLGAVAIGTLTLIGLRIARHTHVTQNGGNVSVQTPFGTVNTNASDVSRDLGVDVYPGARMLKNNAANVQMAGVHTVAAQFETDDPASKVADFYKAKFPDANVSVSNQDHYTIVSTNKKNLITINIEPQDGKTLINVASVGGKDATGDSSD